VGDRTRRAVRGRLMRGDSRRNWPGGTTHTDLSRVVAQLLDREKLRDEEQFDLADFLRNDLTNRGWRVEDLPEPETARIVRGWDGRALTVEVVTGRSRAFLEMRATVVG
jgi:hypothetical protein